MILVNGIKTEESVHNVLGLATAGGLVVFAMTGTASFVLKKRLKWKTWYIKIIRRIHKLLAFGFWGLSLVTMTLGMMLYINARLTPVETARYGFLIWLNIGLMVGITASFELLY